MSKDILGRGLKSLIPEEIEGELKAKEKVLYLKVDEIEVGEHQMRKNFDPAKISELAQSIKEHGIIQPLVVSRKGEGGYQLIAGQRRLKAAKEAGVEEVPVILKDAKSSQKLEMALIENIQREDLNPLEEAEAYQILVKKFNLKPEEIAQKVGKGETTIINSIRLLELPQEIKDVLEDNILTVGHARAMLTLPKEEQLRLLSEIIKRNLTVRDIESRCKNFHESKKPISEKAPDDFDLYLEEVSGNLREALQTKITIQRKGKGGSIVIDFYSKEELERLIELLGKIKSYTEEEK